MYRGSYVKIDNFKGGYCGNFSSLSLKPNEIFDCDNIVIKQEGRGFRSRLGNGVINSTVFNSGAAWQGIADYTQADGDTWLVGVAGTKFGTNSNYGTSFTDSTGAITITSGQDNQWSFMTFNDVLIGFGGPATSPDAPFKWTGSGNAAALGGSPPSAYGCFPANNRAFAYRTSANPSTLYWSILGNAEDWTGTGSGSTVVGSLSDNQKITGAQVLSTNHALIFKESSTYQLLLTSSPFPVYTLFDKVGCVGKFASVNVNGRVYWITQYGRMVSSNGTDFVTYPKSAENLWTGALQSRYPFIVGQRIIGQDYDWIVWLTRSGSGTTNNKAIIWDLINECWLQCTTGYLFAVSTQNAKGKPYFGGYDGIVYEIDKAAQYIDAMTGVAINAYMNYGFRTPDVPNKFWQPNQMDIHFLAKSDGSVTFSYGYEFKNLSNSISISMVDAAATAGYTTKSARIFGLGNHFGFQIRCNTSASDMEIYSIYLRGKTFGQKRFKKS